jgi:putative ABC transport system ATP-binding protein/lipoprotein-releasing system ATP-binding protein
MSKVLLEAKDLKKSFSTAAGSLDVLRSISLTVNEGESVSIRGLSGSGKTTLLQLLGGLEAPDAGEVLIDLKSKGLVSPHLHLGHGVGFVFQNFQLMPELNTLENVMLAAKILGTPDAEFKARTLIESVGLGSRLNHYPSQLSGGECQRVAIARALINDPTVVLADEPTGNLDEATGQQIINLLLGIVAKKQMALILVTHSREFAERTQRQLLLTKGVLSPG